MARIRSFQLRGQIIIFPQSFPDIIQNMTANPTVKLNLKSKLILIEGIPGSGKTTTAQFVAGWLEENEHHPALFLEGDWNHPADYESVACLSDPDFSQIQSQFPDQARLLTQHSQRLDGQWFIKYRQLKHENEDLVPDELLQVLSQFEIYELPAEKHIHLLQERWRRFTAQAAAEDKVYVFECCFLQNPFTTLLAKHNLHLEAIHHHIFALTRIVKCLNPKLIYLVQNDVRKTLSDIRRKRPQGWADFVTWYLTEGEYGSAHKLAGYEGVIEFYTRRQALELELLPVLPLPSLVLSDADDWEKRYNDIEDFLRGWPKE